jgi:hypothetical protein
MAEAPRNDLDLLIAEGLLADLSTAFRDRIRADEVARARRHAAARAYEQAPVVEEIATQILLLSRS